MAEWNRQKIYVLLRLLQGPLDKTQDKVPLAELLPGALLLPGEVVLDFAYIKERSGGMEPTKNLCAQIPVSLHAKVREEQERSGQPLGAYITDLLTEYYKRSEKSMEYTKTLAFQIPESLFYRIKDHL